MPLAPTHQTRSQPHSRVSTNKVLTTSTMRPQPKVRYNQMSKCFEDCSNQYRIHRLSDEQYENCNRECTSSEYMYM